MKNIVTQVLSDQTKDKNYLSIFPHAWSYEPDPMDPSYMNSWLEEDGGLFNSKYESKNTLNDTYQEFDFLRNSTIVRQDSVFSSSLFGHNVGSKNIDWFPILRLGDGRASIPRGL